MVEVIVVTRDASGREIWVLDVIGATQEIISAQGRSRVVNVVHATTGPHYSGDSTC